MNCCVARDGALAPHHRRDLEQQACGTRVSRVKGTDEDRAAIVDFDVCPFLSLVNCSSFRDCLFPAKLDSEGSEDSDLDSLESADLDELKAQRSGL